MSQNFKKCKEDFICLNCGREVKGTGYTNHCPSCLYSLHVDITPGDRLATCGGLMEPVKIESVKNEFVITHRCKKCGYEKRNKVAIDDNLDKFLEGKK